MLRSYLTTLPYTRFILLEDSIEERGNQIFDFLVKTHVDRKQHKVHYFVFHGSFNRAKDRFVDKNNVVVHDCTSNVCGWQSDNHKEDLETTVTRLSSNDVVIVDSLAHVIFQYGLSKTYQCLNVLRNQTCVQQIIALLHGDLLENKEKTNLILEHLCTLKLNIEPKFMSDNGRVRYTYKKAGSKLVREMEEYSFDDGIIVTHKIERPDPKNLLEKSVVPEINPELLSTFRIGLTDDEKQSRDKLVLPYLPKNETEKAQQEGKIFYQFDEVDDWDEEDPDDDLDI